MSNINPIGVHFYRGQSVRTNTGDALVDASGNSVQRLLGTTGLAGATGILGLTGIQGMTGFAFQGATGIQGETGINNLIGQTGIVGHTGLQGITGIVNLGVTGLDGVTGFQGVTGVIGNFGSIGLPGETGLQNNNTGLQGITGTRGLTGLSSNSGATGIYGRTGLSITGLRGITGTSVFGSSGIQGITGIIGLTGISDVTTPNIERSLAGSTLVYFVTPNTFETGDQLDISSTIQSPLDGSPATIGVTFGGTSLFSCRLDGVVEGWLGCIEGVILILGITSQASAISATYQNDQSFVQRGQTTANLGVTQILAVSLSTAGDNGNVLSLVVKKTRPL